VVAQPKGGTKEELAEVDEVVTALRAEAAEQLDRAKDLAARLAAEARKELEDVRARAARITDRERELDQRFARLIELETKAAAEPRPAPVVPVAAIPGVHQNPAEAAIEAERIIARAQADATLIREEAMRLLAIAENEKAVSHEMARTETERAETIAESLRQKAREEADRIRALAIAERRAAAKEAADSDTGAGRYSATGRKLPRIGERANSLLAEMSDLRARSAEEPEADKAV
jgi:hypothetical protein